MCAVFSWARGRLSSIRKQVQKQEEERGEEGWGSKRNEATQERKGQMPEGAGSEGSRENRQML